MLEVGARIPNVTLDDAEGNRVRLRDLRGPIVLYFYPRDNTPGCTQEACDFRDLHPKFGKLKAHVIGVSADSVASHERFAAKHRLPFTLLADPDRKLLEACGAWQMKSLYGRKFMGIVRSTYLFDAQGKLQHVWPKVRVKEHAAEVLAVLSGKELPAKKAAKKKTAKKKTAKKKTAKKKTAKKKTAKKSTKKKAAKKKSTKKKAAKKKSAKKKSTKKKSAKKKSTKKKAAKKKSAKKKSTKKKAKAKKRR